MHLMMHCTTPHQFHANADRSFQYSAGSMTHAFITPARSSAASVSCNAPAFSLIWWGVTAPDSTSGLNGCCIAAAMHTASVVDPTFVARALTASAAAVPGLSNAIQRNAHHHKEC